MDTLTQTAHLDRNGTALEVGDKVRYFRGTCEVLVLEEGGDLYLKCDPNIAGGRCVAPAAAVERIAPTLPAYMVIAFAKAARAHRVVVTTAAGTSIGLMGDLVAMEDTSSFTVGDEHIDVHDVVSFTAVA